MPERRNGNAPEPAHGLQRALIGATAVAAATGVALFIGSRARSGAAEPHISDAPGSSFRRRRSGDRETLVGRTVTINRSCQELHDFWRDFSNLPRFMENVRSVKKLDETRSRWTIEAPAGASIDFVSRITEDVPTSVIGWESEEGADVRNSGRVEFLPAAPGRGTLVRATIAYDPPAGAVGRLIAKVLQREPNVQARRDLRRFKQLMEAGEVTSSAGPSARRSESPTEQYL